MAKKIYEEENIRAIAEKIREKTGEGTTYKVSEMPDGIERVYNEGKSQGTGGYDEGYKAGQKSEYDRFWDNFQQNGKRQRYYRAFSDDSWTNETFKPKYDLVNMSNCEYLFYSSKISGDFVEILNNLGIRVDISNFSVVTQVYRNTLFTRLGEINVSKVTGSLNYFIDSNKYLETIDKLIISEKGTTTFINTFTGNTALKNITIEGVIGNDINFKDCTLLTHESLMSIINALKDFADSKTVTYHNGEYGSYSISETSFDPKGVEWTVTDAVLNGTTLICHGYNEEYNSYDVTITVTDINISAEDVAKIRTIQFDVASYNPEIYEFIVDVVIKVSGEPTQQKTLTIGTANLLKLTEAEKKKATNKGWILA